MADRTTSGAYRIPVTTSKSFEVASTVRPTEPRSFSSPKRAAADFKKCNVVAQERIWKEHLLKEKNAAKSWDQNWRFLTEFDHKGNARVQEKLPDKVSLYDAAVPVTTSKGIGYRSDSPNNRNVRKLELLMTQHKRKTDIAANYF